VSNPTGHILVVDDEPLVVSAVRGLLQLRGFQTTCAQSALEAQKILEDSLQPESQPIDLVVLDRFMPQMSGLQFCRWIKEHAEFGQLPVLMLTAAAGDEDKITGLDTGADDYVTKPYNAGELVARIRALLRSYRLEQELRRRNQQLAKLFTDLQTAYEEVETSRQQLQATASTLQALFDGITDGLYIVDRAWRLVAVNRGRAQQASAAPGSLAKRSCFEALYGRRSPCPNCQVAATFARGRGAQWVERNRSAGGQFTEWELATYPILDNQRRASRVIVMRREVTEQRRLEASLAQAEKLAAVGQLAAGVAHEINNPLTAIIANAQFLTEDLSPMSDSYQSAQLVARAGERAARVVRRLLDFARQEELDCQPLDVNDSLREAMTLMEPQLASSGIRLVTHLEPNLAPVNGSPDHILGIWLNLLINALDALDGRNGERVIEIHSQRLEEFVQVSIIDNGPGIPADQLPHIFHPFYTTKAPGKGTGLGLSTSYLTVEQHGGRIDVISEPGQGTALIVKLPICT
jgi:two-component system NtrC family sensor kinase